MPIVFSAHLRRSRRPSLLNHRSAQDHGLFWSGENKRTVLLVHGLTGTPHEMRFVANFLNQAGYAVSCPRLANHGEPLDVLKATTWQECYQSVRHALLELDPADHPGPIFTAGLSAGALLALLLAEEFPEKIAGVSCLSPTLSYDGWNVPWLYRHVLTPLFCFTSLRHFCYFKEEPPYGIKSEAVRQRVHRYYGRARLHETDREGLAQYGYPYIPASILYQLHLLVRYLRPRLPSITVPVQLIQAEDDDLTSTKNARFIYDRIGSAVKEMVLLQNSYHVITADQERETVAQRIEDFFSRMGRTAAVTDMRTPPSDRLVRHLKLSDCAVFVDFDNTVTQIDVIDDLLQRFSINREWVALEHAWQEGRVGSKECLEGQLRSVKITKDALVAYLSTVPIDPSFRQLLTLFRAQGVEPVIVSDSFSFFIETILKHQKITGVKVYANDIRVLGDRLRPSFPYADGCSRCAHCKKRHLLNGGVAEKTTIYIGDGLSDVCPAQHADLVFAKGKLLDYCRETGIPCVAFDHLGDIYRYLRR